MRDKPSFFAELKRRNVYKVAVTYAVVAWLLMQAASILLLTVKRRPLLKSKPGWSDRTTSWLLLRIFDIKPDFWEYGKP